jgi:site-specific recombinase XerD
MDTNHSPMFSAAYESYLLSQTARRLSKNYLTLQALSRDYWLRRHGDTPLDEHTPDQIRQWLVWLAGNETDQASERPMSSASVDVHFRNLKSFWLWAEREELVRFGAAPVRKVPRPKHTEKLPDVLSLDEVKTLLLAIQRDTADHNHFRNYTIMAFLADTGVRLDELSKLTLDDVNLEQGYCKVLGKGDKERIVRLGLELRRSISKYKLKYRHSVSGETALFTNDMGFRLERMGIRSMVVRALKRHVARPLSKYGPHTLRHSFATLDVLLNGDLAETSHKLGHKDIETTRRYDHLATMLRDGGRSTVDAMFAK